MSITDELREYVRHYSVAGSKKDKTLTAIADRIDEAHKHAIGYVDDRDQETMAENGWGKLPKDADGEYIHVGDEVWSLHPDIHFHVETMELTADGWEVDGCDPVNLHHYHAPTVEGLLFEFAQFWSDEELTDIEHLQPDVAQTIAEYAAKLRLRED